MHVAVSQPPKNPSGESSNASIFPSGYMLTFLLTTLIFFVWGMSNNLTDILVQQFKKSFELNVIQAQLVQTAVFLAYFVMAMPAALLMRRFGYKMGLVVGLVTFAIGTLMFWPAAVIGRARFPASIDSSEETGEVAAPRSGAYGRLLRNPGLMWAVAAQFFYVGAQISTWSSLIFYLKAYTSMTDKAAGYLLTGSLVALAVGRIVSTPLMKFISPAKMIGLYAVLNILLLGVGIVHPGIVGASAILFTSFFMSVMFPTIFALGVKGLGDDTKLGLSLIHISEPTRQ